METLYDVIVVGAGVEGSSTAYHIAKSGGKKVLLLEQVNRPEMNLCYTESEGVLDTQAFVPSIRSENWIKLGHLSRMPKWAWYF